jgi:hypothetical protein
MHVDRERGDLREKPLAFSADSMTKVGLYNASSMNFNPVLGLHQKTNQLLERISQKLSDIQKKPNPFSPYMTDLIEISSPAQL